MAIYHLTAKIVTRARGQSAVASAAYRSAEALRDARIDQTFDYSRKQGVEHSEILAPALAPAWVKDRERLWNEVEKAEHRKDAQVAREIELALPVELSPSQQVDLARDFAKRTFVAAGMVADLSIHRDNPENPHAHVMLTTRTVGPEGFGPKRRDWNAKDALLRWREQWAELQNEHLLRAGFDLRVDHRTLEAQGLDLEPGRKIGVSQERQASDVLPPRVVERVEEQKRIARENGAKIIAHPKVALMALTHQHATFTDHDLSKWLHFRTDGAEQFRLAQLKVAASRELVSLGRDDRGQMRYTSRDMLAIERQMLEEVAQMSERKSHSVDAARGAVALEGKGLSSEQETAFHALTAEGDLKSLIGVAGSGKSRLLAVTREAWEAEGYTVKGMALSGIAAENLSLASGIESGTIASFEFAWRGGRDPLTSNDVIVIDEAGMVGTRQLARVLDAAAQARAKVVLVGDPEQLQAIEAGAAFRGIVAQTGASELNQVRRQWVDWQAHATGQLAHAETRDALQAYESSGKVHQLPSREEARSALIGEWAKDGEADPAASRLMVAYTRDDVRQLNERARAWRSEQGQLGRSESIETERGKKDFAVGERIYFLRNERSLGVRNGSLGTVEGLKNGVMDVKIDGTDAKIALDTRFYRDLDYGYAATVYKAQGATVDRTYILATSHFDRHSTYVALSRHRKDAEVFYSPEDFKPPWVEAEVSVDEGRSRLMDTLSRARSKDLVHDYLDVGAETSGAQHSAESLESMDSIESLQQRAVERWRQYREQQAEQDVGPIKSSRHHSLDGPDVD